MGQIYVDFELKGKKCSKKLKKILVDTGATFSFLPEDVLKEIGAWGPIAGKEEIELADGSKVQARIYSTRAKIKGQGGPATILTFKGTKSVIGSETLESLGLKVDPTTGKLTATRPKGVAYFY